MRCRICNNILGEKEVQFNSLHDEFDPCGTCLQVISEVFDDHIDEAQERVVEDDE